MRVCLLYDCLYPYTVGGAERWYRELAERLAARGHTVTYLTLRQWPRGTRPQVDPRVEVRAVGPRLPLYTGGRRRILPPLVYGWGVLLYLLRHGRRFDVVHTASFPYFSLLAAGLARPLHRYALFVDWHEVWSDAYWRSYLGRFGGGIGAAVQRLCALIPQRAFCFSELHAQRLREEGLRGEPTVLRGQYAGIGPTTVDGSKPPQPPGSPAEAACERGSSGPTIVFAGRLIPEKRALLGLEAVALARRQIPNLQACFYGEGPERGRLIARIGELGLAGAVQAPGFVEAARLEQAIRSSLCLLLPSSREGYGKVVVEAAAVGTPSIVVKAPDNAAAELIEDGVNGYLVPVAEPQAIAQALRRVHAHSEELRRTTAAWFRRRATELSLERSLQLVERQYLELAGGA